jgi:hypothetical protein
LDCWINKRSKLAVGGKRYWPVKIVYQPALTFSINEIVPNGAAQRSKAPLLPAVVLPAALPVATVLAAGSPICIGGDWQAVKNPSAAIATDNFKNFIVELS